MAGHAPLREGRAEPAHLLERLVTDGGPSRETVSGEAAVERRLSTVVGMSFAAFTSAVMLTQGRFAQFLSSQPRDRDAILRELFGVASPRAPARRRWCTPPPRSGRPI